MVSFEGSKSRQSEDHEGSSETSSLLGHSETSSIHTNFTAFSRESPTQHQLTYFSFPNPDEGDAPLRQIRRRFNGAKDTINGKLLLAMILLALIIMAIVACLASIPFPRQSVRRLRDDDQVFFPHNGRWIGQVLTNGSAGVQIYSFYDAPPEGTFLPRTIRRDLEDLPVGPNQTQSMRFLLYEDSVIDIRWDYAEPVTVGIIRGAKEYGRFLEDKPFDTVLRKTSNEASMRYTVPLVEEYYIAIWATFASSIKGEVEVVIQTLSFSTLESEERCSGECDFLLGESASYLLFVAPTGADDEVDSTEYLIEFREEGKSSKYVAIFVSLFAALLVVVLGLAYYCRVRGIDRGE